MSEKPVTRRSKAPVKQPTVVMEARPEQAVVPYDENLLEHARTQWQFGDWQSLAKLDRDTLQHHPDRAKLALLAAAGRLQTDRHQEAKPLIRLAQDWGISKKLIGRILIAGVHNSLGRAAAFAGNQPRALRHFENAIVTGALGSDAKLLTRARVGEQLNQLGLLPGSQGRLQQMKAIAHFKSNVGDSAEAQIKPARFGNTEACAFYAGLGRGATAGGKDQVPFLLLDSKSLPRSGLHYLKNTMVRLLGEQFSFCEWYQEVGCCKQSPCALTGYAQHARDTGRFRLRLIKSHDFELDDPIYQPNRYVRRLILVRDPLFALTSWFALDQLDAHREELLKQGINVQKIWLSHEKELLAPAYRLMDECFKEPSLEMLTDWLSKKTRYLIGFMEKWVKPVKEQKEQYTYVVKYEEIDNFIVQMTSNYHDYLSASSRKAIQEFQLHSRRLFHKRTDPFAVPSKMVTEYLGKTSALFYVAAREIATAEGSVS